ncbi:hypothetical protein LIER_14100 [Lithospermum erythrorhizon]|uniref:Uncharacterized protein n=1 Tax=Lithospermum erythrorhizon TaxID=34254 RepID=A0AAV3Q347_LITER
MVISSGKTTNCLFDNWHRIGIPAEVLSERSISIVRVAAINIVAHAKEVIKWPRGRALTSDIIAFRDGFLEDLGEDEDNLIWFGSDHHKSAQVWDGLRVKPRNVRWWKLIWFRGQVPRFGFTVWLGKSPGNIYFLSVSSQPLFGENCCYT